MFPATLTVIVAVPVFTPAIVNVFPDLLTVATLVEEDLALTDPSPTYVTVAVVDFR